MKINIIAGLGTAAVMSILMGLLAFENTGVASSHGKDTLTGTLDFSSSEKAATLRDSINSSVSQALALTPSPEEGEMDCSDIAGTWSGTENGTVTCAYGGRSETQTISEMALITIEQDGCNISYPGPLNVARTGIVEGSKIRVNGRVAMSLVGDLSFVENSLTGEGIVSGDKLTVNSSGITTGTLDGIGFSCTTRSTTAFTRSGQSAPLAFDGTWIGTAMSDPQTNNPRDPCRNATFTLTITNSQISGVAVNDQGDQYAILGSVTTEGAITIGLAVGSDDIVPIEGAFSRDDASGTWRDISGWTGTWNASRSSPG
jgi:hypothetical protein